MQGQLTALTYLFGIADAVGIDPAELVRLTRTQRMGSAVRVILKNPLYPGTISFADRTSSNGNKGLLESRAMIHERGWECFASYHDELAAGVVADYLCRNDCPAQVMGKLGAQLNDGVRVLVPGQLLHRAKWLWAQADLSEGELQFLISGELPGGD